ncbi:MAG: 2-C-methyl-D-erythritol 2,4-cyclodiphosphate synthase, partial [Dehalococcoidia bacterium]
IDALLGAAALGDIGTHFPDSDPQYKDISSIVLLRRAGEMLHHGYKIENIDATILCERPKLAPYIDEMRQNVSDALGIERGRVSVKATTSASLGFAGRGEGIAAHAVAFIEGRKDEGL